MPTSYTSSLGLALPVTGELSGTWGDTVNNYITQYLDASVAGALTVNADTTLTKTTGSALGATSSQYAILIASGHSTNITITAPAVSKTYLVINKSLLYTVTVRGAGPTTGVVISANNSALVAWTGSDFEVIFNNIYGTTLSTITAVGFGALANSTSSTDNAAFGALALGSATTGSGNTAVGGDALLATNGSGNTAVGQSALRAYLGNDAVAVGLESLAKVTSGTENTACGAYSAFNVNTGQSNTVFGYSAGFFTTTGSQNTIVGANAAATGTNNLTTGANNTVIGYNAAPSSSTVSNQITLGNSSISTLRCQVTTITSLSDARDKTNINDLSAGLTFVNALRPVAFDWNMRDGGKVGEHDTGFIAQDLKAAQESTGVNIPGLVFEGNPDRLEAGYGKLIPVLVKAVQELSAEVERLKQR